MKRSRFFRQFAAALLAFALLSSAALAAAPAVPANGYVADAAKVLNRSTVDYIVEKGQKLTYATGGAIVVVTVDFLDGRAIDDYAVALFNDWGIGDAQKNNGLLILLAIGEDDYYTLTGTGIQKALPASQLKQFTLDYLEDDFARKNYDAGVKKLYDAFYDWFERYYGQELDQVVLPADEGQVSGIQTAPGMGSLTVFLLLLFVAVLVLAVDFARYARCRRLYFGMPGYLYRPFLFGRPHRSRRHRPPHPPFSGGPGGFDGMNGFGGGASRGGGAGRRAGSFRLGGLKGFGGFGGGRSGGFGGGSSRGGGAGRR